MASIDKLMWGIAADAMTAVTTQLGVLVEAAETNEEIVPVAEARIDTLRRMGELALRKADDFEQALNGTPGTKDSSLIADEFSEAAKELGSQLDNG